MKYLFLHQSFPGQFQQIVTYLAAQAEHEVVFICREATIDPIKGVKCYAFKDSPLPPFSHHYIQALARAAAQGQAVYQVAAQLKQKGFYPDRIVAHSGWGCSLYMKDLFPQAKLISYCEWFFHAHNSEEDFDPAHQLSVDDICLIRTTNAPFLLDLAQCDAALSPTFWQKSRFPGEYHDKITVIHDGVDTDFYAPDAAARLILPRINLDLTEAAEIVTYVARGKDRYRGYPQFMEMLQILLAKRPQCHVVIVGGDSVAYGPGPEGYGSYREMMQDQVTLDWNRVHFTGPLQADEYRLVLQASSLHVYLTYPYVLSWSFMEALSTGCLVLASATAPVTEVVQEGVNGFLAEFFSVEELAYKADVILARRNDLTIVRQQARRNIIEKYGIRQTLPQQIRFLEEV